MANNETGVIRTQRQLKRAIFSAKEKLEDTTIFLSDAYKHFLTTMRNGIVDGTTGETVIFRGGENGAIAYTDGSDTHINYDNCLATGLERTEKNTLFLGLNLHEIGHLLFSDFDLLEKIRKKLIMENVIYPMPPSDTKYLDELQDFVQTQGTKAIVQLYCNLNNCIEDGFVDRAVMSLIKGYAYTLRFVRERDRTLDRRDYAQMRADKLPDEDIFQNLVLNYARHGDRLYTEAEYETGDELLAEVRECEDCIRKAVFTISPMQRAKASWAVFCHLFHFVKMQNDKKQNQQQQNQQNQQNQQQQSGQQGNQQQTGQQGNQQQSGKNSNSQSKQPEENQQPTGQTEHTEKGQSKPEQTPPLPGQGGIPVEQGPSQGTEVTENAGQSASQSLSQALEKMGQNTPNTEKTERRNTQKNMNGGTMPNSSASQKLSEAMSQNGQENQQTSTSASENGQQTSMEKLTEEVAKEEVAKQQENQLKKEMQVGANAIKNGIHRTVNPSPQRVEVTNSGRMEYHTYHRELDEIVRRFIKDFQKEITERQTGDTLTGLYTGKRITSHELYRQDLKIFNRKILPEDIPDMAVGIMVDLSGSMSGERIMYAKKCAYITYSFCKKLGIPTFVVGHDASRGGDNTVHIKSIVDEYSLDGKDALRIFSMEAGWCNRDGYALRYCLQKLKAIPCEQKLMLVISDGRPNGYNYSLAEGRADCQDAVSKAIKDGITTICAGIGEDAGTVKSVYKEGISEKNSAHFLDITDLKKLPKAFIKIIKKALE